MSCKFDYDALNATPSPSPSDDAAPGATTGIASDLTQRVHVEGVEPTVAWQAAPSQGEGASTSSPLGRLWRERSTRTKVAVVAFAVFVALGAIASMGNSPDEVASTEPSPSAIAVADPTPTLAATPTMAPDPTVTPAPTPTPAPTAEPTATPTPAPAVKVSYAKLSARNWAKVVKNPDAYLGKTYQLWGCISQFDAATGPDSFRAETSNAKEKYWYLDTENAYFVGDEARLADFVTDDVVLMNVTSLGSFSYDTQAGGNTTVPLFSVNKISRKGSCD